MCILFLSISKNPDVGGYKLILASNRDEMFARPTNSAQFWPQHPEIIGGQDMEPGKEGGTWLALKKNGKIGSLLNIFTDAPQSADKLGRGFLVNEFLMGNASGLHYAKCLQSKSHLYNPFNFVTIEIQKTSEAPALTYFSSKSEGAEPIQFQVAASNEVYAFGNSVFHLPLRKVTAGKLQMEQLVQVYGKKENEAELISGLLDILKSREKYFPDPQMQEQAPTYSDQMVEEMSSKFVFVPSMGYGSRTHTIILIDHQNHVQFMEWTLDTPVVDCENLKWIHSKHSFYLE